METIKQLKETYQLQLESMQYEECVLTANKLSNLCPDDANAYNMLAHSLKLCNQLDPALKCYQLSLLMDNNQANVHLVVGEILSMQGKRSEAFSCYLKGMELNPEIPAVLHKTGNFLIDAGYLEEAEMLLSKALLAGCTSVVFDLLDLYDKQGNKEKLKEFVFEHNALFSVEKENLSLANAYLSLKEYEKAIFYLKGMKLEAKADSWLRAYNNILAQAYEKKGMLSRAFINYQEQNARSHTLYSGKEAEAHFNQSIGVANNIKISEKMAVAGLSRQYKPLFIVGLPRSGTSLIEQVLNVDRSVVAAGELNFIESAYNEYVNGRRSLAELSEWYQDKLEFIIKDRGEDWQRVHWVSDKMPTNFAYIGFIKEMLPQAQFLYCKRDPMDNGLSIFKQNFDNSHGYANRLDDVAHFTALERKMMEHWLAVYSSSIYTVSYEKLVTQFDEETQQIYKTLGLEWSKDVRLFYQKERLANTASYEQVRNPVHANSVGLYRKFELELSPLRVGLENYGVIESNLENVQDLRYLTL